MRLAILAFLASLACTMPEQSGADTSPGAYAPPPLESYRFFTDQVMGGVSTGEARVVSAEGARHLVLTGSVSTENRGGFIQARVDIDVPFPDRAQGVVIRVRGNGQRYFVHLRTRGTILPWQYYQAGFETTGDWQDLRIPFEAFVPSGSLLRDRPRPGTVTSLAAVAYGRDHEADLSFQWLGLY